MVAFEHDQLVSVPWVSCTCPLSAISAVLLHPDTKLEGNKNKIRISIHHPKVSLRNVVDIYVHTWTCYWHWLF